MNFQQLMNTSKNSLKFYVRILPSEKFDWDCLRIEIEEKILYVRHSLKPPLTFICFKTDRIFLNSCQNEVYSSIINNHVFGQIFNGVDHTVMSYGQNYSGKSFTMSGLYNQYEFRGIIPRFVIDLFEYLETKLQDYIVKVYLSAVDICNDHVYDLLSKRKECCKELKKVREVQVSTGLECLELIFKSEAWRFIVKNKTYNSHSGTNVVTFKVTFISANCNEPIDKTSKIHFVDLAGVETISRNPLTSFKDQQTQGGANLTKSLLESYALRSKNRANQVILKNGNQNMHVLTKYLNKSFSTTSCISLICHVRPNHEDIMITLSALKFGRTFQTFPLLKPEEHTEINYDMTIQKLKQEVQSLKDELVMIDTKEIKIPIKLCQERIDFAKRTVFSFLNGELSDNDLLSLIEDPNLILNLIKSIHNQPVVESSVSIQTEFPLNLELTDIKVGTKATIVQEDRQTSLFKSPSGKEPPKKKSGNVKDTSKSKLTENMTKQSKETQVNLIEPNVTLPHIHSRESLWAMFLIKNPSIHDMFEKLNADVAEKNMKMNCEISLYDSINQTMNEHQLVLHQLVTYGHKGNQENIEKGFRMPENEAYLVQELQLLQRDLENSKQRLINSQFDWLETLEKLSKRKEIIEIDFKQFCVENNYVAIESYVNEEEVQQNQSITNEDTTDTNLKKFYHFLQNKHLYKVVLK
ncbi:kinesin-like protein KIF9 [Macrosteles quadrilineatus]|uniref:kinesin-like protein KIF9 n=1 Tax=Macrosteles quadrilineatus TaxID=74068 RepID=UPI0023E26CE6|nr:kinesin-like protein KIF9 [Macrosteles quadrilineatus]